MDTSFDIFPSQSSTDSACNVSIHDIHGIFPEAAYCQSHYDQSLWVLFLDSFGWSLLRTNVKTGQLSKEDFVLCFTVPVDSFVQNEIEVNSDPFSDDFSSAVLPDPVVHLVSSEVRHDIQISKALFRKLFTREALLSPTASYCCLVGLPDGRFLSWHPALGKTAQLICHMYQPVVDILAGPKGSLLCVGQQGKVICISAKKEHAEFGMVFLHGPVTSCCYDGRRLHHTSTSYHLWRDTFSFDDRGQAKVVQSRIPVMSARRVFIDSLSNKVQYISEDNVLEDVPPDVPLADFASEHRKLHWLSDKISEQGKRVQLLSQLTQKYSFLLHDLTCAAWLLTPGKCGLKCTHQVSPIPGQDTTFNLRVTFSELGKMCPSGLWYVCCTVGQKLGSSQTKLSKTSPVSTDVVCVDLTVPVCLGSKIKCWGGHLRPPLDVECGLLFGGVPTNPLLASRPCPPMKFALQSFVLDELSFLTGKGFHTPLHSDSVENFITNIAKQKTKQNLERRFPVSLTGKLQCSLKILAPPDKDSEETLWQKILPENLRGSHCKEFSLLGHDVRLWTSSNLEDENEAKHLSLFIETDCPSLLAGIRTSAVRRMGVGEQPNVELYFSKDAMTKAQTLQSELQILKESQSFEKVLQFYLKLRNEFSSNLMII